MGHYIAITSGDFNGIGPEVILKTLAKGEQDNITPIILSSSEVIDFYIQTLSLDIDYNPVFDIEEVQENEINVLESYGEQQLNIEPGGFTKQSGKCAMLAVEKGILLCKSGHADALVTAPISKEGVNLAGYNIPGHTEFLAKHTNTKDFMMMLVNDSLRVGLATIHIPIAEVPNTLSRDTVEKHIGIMERTLKHDFSIQHPKIAVLGLNPHAGDGGIIGKEEIDIIEPVIQKMYDQGISVSGPHPADGFFGNQKYQNYNAILAMYHDQGLIPFKTLSFGAGVNFTAGLPIIRTSPDHGTAFDIAGQNKANASSFEQAYSLAGQLAHNRKNQSQPTA